VAEIYDIGDVARLSASFEDSTGALADPATISLLVTQPDGTATTYTYSGAQVIKDSTGRYHYDLSLVAGVGTWEYRWTTTGTPALVIEGYFTVRTDPLTELVRDVRRSVRDFPDVTWVTDNPLAAGAALLTLPSTTDVAKFPKSGMTIEFDDPSAERAKTTAAADVTATTVAIRRGQDGTVARSHVLDTPVLIEPRFSRQEIVNAISLIVDSELWPQVWLSGELQLTYQAGSEYYAAPVPDIMECSYAYQLSAGLIYACHVDFLQSPIADQTNFPNGAILLRRPQDAGTIYVAYRAKPSVGTLSGVCRNLVLMGATAHLLMLEEAVHVGPGASAIEKRVADGSKLRAGATLWQRFINARQQAGVSLASGEAAVRTRFVRAVR